jgi:hypothetical protein
MRRIDGIDVVEDGESVRVPMMLTDAAGQRPGFAPVTDKQRQLRQETRDSYIADLTNAWRSPNAWRTPHSQPDLSTTPEEMRRDPAAVANAVEQLRRQTTNEMSADELEQKRRAIHTDYTARLTNAWRSK